eukprot:scaffold1557_cov246-Pinguiococcus_pyrenoidosus.AAC.28
MVRRAEVTPLAKPSEQALRKRRAYRDAKPSWWAQRRSICELSSCGCAIASRLWMSQIMATRAWHACAIWTPRWPGFRSSSLATQVRFSCQSATATAFQLPRGLPSRSTSRSRNHLGQGCGKNIRAASVLVSSSVASEALPGQREVDDGEVDGRLIRCGH